MSSSNEGQIPPRNDDPSHSWLGQLYIVLGYFWAGVLALLAPAILVLGGFDSDSGLGLMEVLLLSIVFALLGGLPFILSRGVSKFHKWAWWVCIILVPLSILGALATLTDPAEESATRAGSAMALVVNALWLHYFWVRRGDFRASRGG